MTVGLIQQSYTVIESASPVTVCAVLTGLTERDVLVTVTTVQGWLIQSQCRIVVSDPQSSLEGQNISIIVRWGGIEHT